MVKAESVTDRMAWCVRLIYPVARAGEGRFGFRRNLFLEKRGGKGQSVEKRGVSEVSVTLVEVKS